MRTDLLRSSPRRAARVLHVDYRDSAGDEDILCLVNLDRSLTERERFWFETAELWRDPAPRRFLINGAYVSFLCAAGEEKERWERQLAAFLDQAWKEA